MYCSKVVVSLSSMPKISYVSAILSLLNSTPELKTSANAKRSEAADVYWKNLVKPLVNFNKSTGTLLTLASLPPNFSQS